MTGKKPPSLSNLTDRCISIRPLSQIHAQLVVSSRLFSDSYAASRLLVSYLSLGLPTTLALSFLSNLPSPNSFIFNVLIRSFSLSSSTSPLSFSLFSRMLRSSVLPGKHTFPFLLKACSSIKSISTATQVHTHVVKNGFLECDCYVMNGLLHAYACCEFVGDARKVFDEMPLWRHSMIWTTMVSAYVRNGMMGEAVVLFETMVESGVEWCDATLVSVLAACGRMGRIELGRRIHDGFVGRKGRVGVILGTALVDMYVKNGAILEAREVFVEMPEKNTATWNAMICGLAHHGYCNEALELFQEMDGVEVRPNDVTFTGALTACCRAGWVELGWRIFHAMKVKYAVEPKVEHYSCMVDLLSRNGKLVEAEVLVRGMKWEADVVVWGALLAGCHDYGQIEVAERVVDEILKVDPENHGVYVVLSNMYAEVGRWEDVERLRSVMKGEGLKKIPGWCSVDGHDHSHDCQY